MALFSSATTNSSCKTGPQLSGPPKVTIFGGGGVGALVNAIVSPTSSSIIAFDIVDSGSGYTDNTFISIEDLSGQGTGASAKVNIGNTGVRTRIGGTTEIIGGTITTTGGTSTTGDTFTTGGATTTTGGTITITGAITTITGDSNITSGDTITVTDGTTTISGGNSTTIGDTNTITEATSITIGGNTTTTGNDSVSVGDIITTTGSIIEIVGNNIKITGGVTTIAKSNNEDYGITNSAVLSSGDGYLTGPDGSLCGNGFVWKEPDEGYVVTADGNYLVVQINRPVNVSPGDVYYPPNGSSREITAPETIALNLEPVTPPIADVLGNPYQVVLSIEEVVVLDSGFGYRPEDKIIITPDNGAVLEPVINSRGQIESVNVISGGIGFGDIPEIKTNSLSGFNAQMNPIFKVTRLNENIALDIPKNATIIDVIDCVGKF